MAFPTPTVNDTRDILGIFQFVNDQATGGIFFPVMLLVIWFIAFIGSIAEGRPASRAFIFSSFIAIILGSMLAILNFLDINYVYFLIILVGIGLFWLTLIKSRNT